MHLSTRSPRSFFALVTNNEELLQLVKRTKSIGKPTMASRVSRCIECSLNPLKLRGIPSAVVEAADSNDVTRTAGASSVTAIFAIFASATYRERVLERRSQGLPCFLTLLRPRVIAFSEVRATVRSITSHRARPKLTHAHHLTSRNLLFDCGTSTRHQPHIHAILPSTISVLSPSGSLRRRNTSRTPITACRWPASTSACRARD